MGFIKFLFTWHFWASLALSIILLVALWFATFSWLDDYADHDFSIEIPNLFEVDVFQAVKMIEEKGLMVEVDSVKYNPNKNPNQVLEFYPAHGKMVKKGRTVFIKSNPYTFAPVEMPDVENKSLRLVTLHLLSAGLNVGDTIFIKDLAKDVVLKTMYKDELINAGDFLPRNSKIDLYVGSGPQDAIVPTLLGYTYTSAKSIIAENSFKLGKVNFVGEITDSITARVFFQFPLQEEVYEESNNIEIWVSNLEDKELKDYVSSLNKEFKIKTSGNLMSIRDYYDESSETYGENSDFEEIRQENIEVKPKRTNEKLSEEDSLIKEFLKKNN